MNAGKQKIADMCPNCKAPQLEHRLTCRRCGHYLHDKDGGSMVGSPAMGALLGLCFVALVVGFCCFLLLHPRPTAAPAVNPTASVQTTAATTQPAGRKHRHRH